jgi:hypothetical protein
LCWFEQFHDEPLAKLAEISLAMITYHIGDNFGRFLRMANGSAFEGLSPWEQAVAYHREAQWEDAPAAIRAHPELKGFVPLRWLREWGGDPEMIAMDFEMSGKEIIEKAVTAGRLLRRLKCDAQFVAAVDVAFWACGNWNLGPKFALAHLKRFRSKFEYIRRLVATAQHAERFDKPVFNKPVPFMRAMEKGFWLMAILAVPIGWYFGAIPGVVAAEIGTSC